MKTVSRRSAIKGALTTCAAFCPVLAVSSAHAQDKVNPSDALAASLQYVEDATSSQRAAENHRCAVCLQYNGAQSDEWAGCNIFAGNLVKGDGWCSAFVARG